MKNSTPAQRKIVDVLKKKHPGLTIRWSEERGVASVVIGSVLNWKAREEPADLLARFLREFGVLFGPRNILKTYEYVGSEKRKGGHVRIRAMQKARKLPIYGATLILFADKKRGVFRVQCGFYRKVDMPPARLGARAVDFSAREAGLAQRLRKRLEADPEGKRCIKRMQAQRHAAGVSAEGAEGPEFPLATPPKLWLYPTKSGLRQAFKVAALQPVECLDTSGRTYKTVEVADLVIDAVSGRITEEGGSLGMAYTDTTGDGLSTLEDDTGTHLTRPLLVVQDDGGDFFLINRTHTPHIIVHDAGGSTVRQDWIDMFVNDTDVSKDPDGHWNQTTDSCATADRVASQQPEVDAHHYADESWQFYHGLGWDGFDDGGWGNHCPVRVAAHTGMGNNAGFWRYIDTNGKHWGYLNFLDGSCSGGNVAFDFFAGDPAIFAHEFQHAVTYFGARDSAGDPGYLDTSGWHRAIHEGLSDTMGGLRTGMWVTPGPWRAGVERGGKPFRRIEFPRSTDNKNSIAYWDHYDDRNLSNVSDNPYRQSTILSHAAFLAGQGGVHQRTARGAELIPVVGAGRGTIAEIFHYAVTEFFDNIPANHTGGDTMLEAAKLILDAAEEVSGSDRTCQYVMLRRALYAVGLYPYDDAYNKIAYGGEACMLPWTIDWKHSQSYLGFPPQWYRSPDLFINNGKGVEYDAVVGQENKLFARVRNIGDEDLNDVKVRFYYRAYGTNLPSSSTQWKECKDQAGVVCVLDIPLLAAENMNFTDENNPPANQAVNWFLRPADVVAGVDHFCLRAVIECAAANHDHDCPNQVQSNVSYAEARWGRSFDIAFLVANFEKKAIPLDLQIEHTLPGRIELEFLGRVPPEKMKLKPGTQRKLTWRVAMPRRAPQLLAPPYDGHVFAKVVGSDIDGKFRGTLTGARTIDKDIPGRGRARKNQVAIEGMLSGSIGSKMRIAGRFVGELNRKTGTLQGNLTGDVYRGRRRPIRNAKLKLKGPLQVLRAIHFTQRIDGEPVGGVTVHMKLTQLGLPWSRVLPKRT